MNVRSWVSPDSILGQFLFSSGSVLGQFLFSPGSVLAGLTVLCVKDNKVNETDVTC